MNGNGADVATPFEQTPRKLPDGVRELGSLISGIEKQVADWAAETTGWIAASGKLNGTTVDKHVRPAVQEMLQSSGSKVAGAGFVATLGLLGPGRSYIAWWQGDDMERVDALANFSPQSLGRYTKAEWFRIPVATGQPHVTGPFIDLLCTDEYVLTFTHPVFKGAEVVGIVGVDVTAQMLERLGLAPLRKLGSRAALVNDGGRTVICAAPDIDAGDLVLPAPGADSWRIGRQFRAYASAEPAVS